MFCVDHIHDLTFVCLKIFEIKALRNNIRGVIGNSEECIVEG